MIIYGVALLALCYIGGQLLGDWLGILLHANANVGGVGFAMLFLILINSWLEKKGYLDELTSSGLRFWSQMYIPIVVAMAATQNVKAAFSSGMVAILAGFIPVLISFAIIPVISRLIKS